MKKLTRRTWVLLSVLLALITLFGIVRVRNVYRASQPQECVREVDEKQNIVWVVEGIATSTRRDMKLCRFSGRVMKEGVDQLLSYSTVFLNHDYECPVGRVVSVKGLGDRILVKIEISKTQPKIWGLIREGVIRSFSIGAIVIEETLEHDTDIMEVVTVIERAQIMEVSVVFIPANPDARITTWYTELR